MGEIIDGKALSAKIDETTAEQVLELKRDGINPKLVVVLVGNNEASKIYTRNKHKRAEKLGIASEIINLPENITQADLLGKIDELNNDVSVHGILVQMPLPEHIDDFTVTTAIDPKKDADGFHPVNVGKLQIGELNQTSIACTPAGIMEMFKEYNVNLDGKRAVVIGRSNIVGKPMAALLMAANATVTVVHSHTKNLSEITRSADIIVSAVGKANFLHADQVKNDAVIIDVGMNRDENGKLTGDVAFEEMFDKVSLITPVPKGVGPMTISMLMKQTVNLAKWSK